MRKINLPALVVLLALCALTAADAQQTPNRTFVPVEGASLQSKMDAAIKQGAAGAAQSRYWTAYSFDVRPGLAIDFEFVSEDGNQYAFSGSSVSFGDSAMLTIGGNMDTRNVGVFLLRERAGGEIVRLETYNLERRREYSGYPVYWLGRASNDESLTFLRGLVEANRTGDLAAQATRAIALHDDRRVGDMLEAIARSNVTEDARAHAIFWLGYSPNPSPPRQAVLADLARNERETMRIRRSAINAFGRSKDAATVSALQGFYNSFPQQELKRAALSAIAQSNSREAVEFLIKVARTDADAGMKKKALSYLGTKAGEQSLGALGETIERSDAETELQKQAVSALSRRPSEESVPMLIKVARTHAKPEVRKEALRQLARTGDERALELFREILLK